MMSARRRPDEANDQVDCLWLVIGSRKEKTFWEIRRDSIKELSSFPANAWPIISFDEEDRRIVVTRRLSNKRAKSLLRREYGAAPRVINDSAKGVIYGRSIATLSHDYKVIPAVSIIDSLLSDQGWPEQRYVVGFMLEAERSHNVILGLWGIHPNREVTPCQLTENATQPSQIIQSYCKTNGVDEANLIIYGIDEMFQSVNRYRESLRQYPLHDDLFGIPKFSLWRAAAMASVVLTILTLSVGGYQWIRGRQLDKENQVAITKTKAARESVVQMFNQNIQRVADRSSLNYRKTVELARDIYAPGGVVSISSTKVGTRLRFTLPINKEGSGSADNFAPQITPVADFIAANERTIKGIRPTIAIGAAGNEINYDYLITEDNRRLLNYIDR